MAGSVFAELQAGTAVPALLAVHGEATQVGATAVTGMWAVQPVQVEHGQIVQTGTVQVALADLLAPPAKDVLVVRACDGSKWRVLAATARPPWLVLNLVAAKMLATGKVG